MSNDVPIPSVAARIVALPAQALRLRVDPSSLGFASTDELAHEPLPWIGQARAQTAARFGLTLDQPHTHLFVLGAVGTGRSTLLAQEMRAVAAQRPVPPDLCYLHNFSTPERPRALRLPAGQGRQLRQRMAEFCQLLQVEIPKRLSEPSFKAALSALEKTYSDRETEAFAALSAFARQRHFALRRESGQLIFTLLDDRGEPLTAEALAALDAERRAAYDEGERELRAEILRFLEVTAGLERALREGVGALRQQAVRPLLDRELDAIRQGLRKQIKDTRKLGQWLDAVERDVLQYLELFEPADEDDDAERRDALERRLQRYRVNLVVDNADQQGAPVIIEDNPLYRPLFGSIEYQTDNDVLVTDFSRIRAGSLLRAHGGFLMLHLRDLLADELVWEKLRRFLRSGRLQIEEPGTMFSALATTSLEPEAVDVDVKIVLIGSDEQFYALQEADPEFARHFRIKVDFAETFVATDETRRATGVFVAHTARRLGLPPFSADAVARLIEDSHREAEDQRRQSAAFGRTEALVVEAATVAQARAARRVERGDVEAAIAARNRRHDYPDERLREAIADGDRVVHVHGARVGQLNGLAVVDLGDYRFGAPIRVAARTLPGQEGLLNIEREVELSGPIHDKAVLVLHSYLSALFAPLAPLALTASIMFEQEYSGIEGDSASCAEFYALLSALAGVPLRQGIAVTGAINPFGEVLPIGGVNEKIEGFYRVCAQAGLDGTQGVLIPARNRRHLMLADDVCEAVAAGCFHVWAVDHVADGMTLLTGVPFGAADPTALGALAAADHADGASPEFHPDSVLGRAAATLVAYRRACLRAGNPRAWRRR
ncbi:Lon protease family protein [Tepidimonas charontis]|uniref:endopeptidase La n=1 Tax=Tepidimonas charontis TaxID=2267262 RepID=A0A554XHG7_9BURK|nr:ATP-binding protein [Tepidimonas charontis]TSE35263.1 Lon protease [Tepidimonas charontis]